MLSVKSREGYAHTIEESQSNDVEADQKIVGIGIDELISASADNAPFILKIDIEGSEGKLFEVDIDIISRFPIIVVELHDWMFKDIVSTPIMKFIYDARARVLVSHDLLIIVQDDLLAPEANKYA